MSEIDTYMLYQKKSSHYGALSDYYLITSS